MANERLINLDDYDDSCSDYVVTTLQLLTMMHREPHRLWRATQNPEGGWDYEKT